MSSGLTTTYFGHTITIEPAEWGYLVLVCEPGAGTRLVAVSTSAMQALESAFEIVDDTLRRPFYHQARRLI